MYFLKREENMDTSSFSYNLFFKLNMIGITIEIVGYFTAEISFVASQKDFNTVTVKSGVPSCLNALNYLIWL